MSLTLSPRQLQVLRLIGDGLCRKQIAIKLNLSPKTIEYHCANLQRRAKTERFNSVALFRWGLQQGILTIKEPPRCKTCGQLIGGSRS